MYTPLHMLAYKSAFIIMIKLFNRSTWTAEQSKLITSLAKLN